MMVAGAALLLGGCASVEMAQYTVTSFAEIPLKKQAKVKIVANNDELSSIADSLKAELGKSKDFTVVEEQADYWFVLNGADQYVSGAPAKKVAVVKKENASGGSEAFEESNLNLASAAKGVSVAVYKTADLTPVHYFGLKRPMGFMSLIRIFPTEGRNTSAIVFRSRMGRPAEQYIAILSGIGGPCVS